MRTPLRFLLLFAAASGIAATARDACCAGPLAITSVDVGFANHFQLGAWTQVVVTLQGGSDSFAGRVEVVAPDSDGVPVTFRTPEEPPVAVEAGKERRAVVLVKIGQADAQLHVRAVGSSGEVATRSLLTRSVSAGRGGAVGTSLSGTSRLMIVLGPPVGLAEALEHDLRRDDVATYVVNVETAAVLPEIWPAYDGVDTVVLSAGKEDSPAGALSASQCDALLEWVSLGGRVVLATGGDAEGLLAPGGPLAEFLPGRLDGSHELREARAIEAFCDSEYPIKIRGGRLGVPVPILAEVRGRILAFEGADTNPLPLITRENRGLGEIILIGFDVAEPPLADWAGRADLWDRLIGNLSPDDVAFVEKASTGLTSLGYNDLVGQLRGSLDVFRGVQTAPFALVAALAVVYLAIIGPVDYYLVRRTLARPALTWLTLPVWILAFSLLAWWLANRFKGDVAHANSVELVDIDVTNGKVRGTIWTHIFIPQLDSVDLTLDVRLPGGDRPAEAQSRFAWLGLPGDALGGMQGSSDDAQRTIGYSVSPHGDTIDGLTLSKWSTKSLSAQWIGRTGRAVRAELAAVADGMLTGRIENTSGLALANARLFHGPWTWSLGDLRPGATVDLAAIGDPLTARTVLNGRPLTGYGGAEEYDPAGTQIDRILDRMMWYELAGGTSAAKLLNRNQGFCDMSSLVGAGRAVLVGACQAEGSRVTASTGPVSQSGDLRLVVCRFVIPVP